MGGAQVPLVTAFYESTELDPLVFSRNKYFVAVSESGSKYSSWAMRYTLDLMHEDDRLYIFHAYAKNTAKAREAASATIEQYVATARQTHPRVEIASVLVHAKKPGEAIVQWAEDLRMSFVVLGYSRHSFIGNVRRSLGASGGDTYFHVLDNCKVPVILVTKNNPARTTHWWIINVDFSRASHWAFHVLRPLVRHTTTVDLVHCGPPGARADPEKAKRMTEYRERFLKEQTGKHCVCDIRIVDGEPHVLLPELCQLEAGVTLLILGNDPEEDSFRRYIHTCLQSATADAILVVKPPPPKHDDTARSRTATPVKLRRAGEPEPADIVESRVADAESAPTPTAAAVAAAAGPAAGPAAAPAAAVAPASPAGPAPTTPQRAPPPAGPPPAQSASSSSSSSSAGDSSSSAD